MVKIKLFGTLRLKTGFKGMEADIRSVKEACRLMAQAAGIPEKEFKQCVVAVNGVQCKMSTKVEDGDEVTFLSPSGGG